MYSQRVVWHIYRGWVFYGLSDDLKLAYFSRKTQISAIKWGTRATVEEMSHILDYAPFQEHHASYKINLYDKVYKEQSFKDVISSKAINKGVLHPGTNPPRITTNITSSGTATYELRDRKSDSSTLWKGNHGPRTFGATLQVIDSDETTFKTLKGKGKDDDGAEFELELCINN